jgi:hypothetical protein
MTKSEMTRVLSEETSDELIRKNSDARFHEEMSIEFAPTRLSSRKEILVPIPQDRDSKTRESMQYAITLAKRFGMKLLLITTVRDSPLPRSYVEYARIERITDVYYSYFEAMAESAFSEWRRTLQGENIEFRTLAFTGNMRGAIHQVLSSSRDIGLIVMESHSYWPGIIQTIFRIQNMVPKAISRIPVLVLP